MILELIAVADVSNKERTMHIVYNVNGTQHTIVEIGDCINTIASQTHMTADELCSVIQGIVDEDERCNSDWSIKDDDYS